jgi:hypothetical protein
LVIDNLASNTFVPVVTNLNSPIGIDFHAPSNSLIVSCNANSNGQPFNFVRIYTNGTNTVVTNWSGVRGLPDEIKLATAKLTAGGFTNGQLFFGNHSQTNRIAWVPAAGTSSNLTFATLTNDTFIRGSLHVDDSGSFDGDVIAVTGNGTSQGGGVWRVNSNGVPTRIAHITNTHLEGVIALTNDATKWGPWAGKIIAGSEILHAIYAIAPSGVVTTNFLGIDPEDFDIVPPNQNLYLTDPDRNTVLKLSSSYLTNFVGDLMITQAGEVFPNQIGKLFFVRWDAPNSNFAVRSISYNRPDGSPGHFEHVTFAPLVLSPETP